jgi:hypothetical protein
MVGILFAPVTMKKSNVVYRGHAIESVGHGKRAAFHTTINDKPHSALTLTLIKADIDKWIDEGEEPVSP